MATAARRRRRPRRAPAVGGRVAARPPGGPVHEPRHRARPRAHAARLGRRGRAPPAATSGCTPARAPPTTCARSPPSPPRRPGRSWSPTATSSPSARCWPACSPSRGSAPACSPPAAERRRPFGFKTRSNRGRIVSAGSPYHAVRRPTGTFLGVLKVAPADRPGVAPVAERLAGLVEPGAARRLAGGARLQGRPLAPHARAVARWTARPASRRPRARRSTPPRSRPRTPPSSSAGARSRPTTSPRCCSSASSAPACTSTRRACARCSGPAPARRPRCERAAERDRRARRGPRAAQLGGQGLGRLLHDVLRLDLLEVHRPLGGAPRADAEPGDAVLDRASACSPRPASRTPSAGAWSRARVLAATSRSSFDCVDGQLARYTRQFSKLGAWLDSIFDRTKEYVVFAGLGDRREPHRRPGVGARRRGARAADHAPRDRLLVPRLPAPGDRRDAAAADRGPVRRPAPRVADDRAGGDRRGRDGGRAGALEPAPEPMTLRRRARRPVARRRPQPRIRWAEEDRRLPDRRALRGDLDHRRAVRRARRRSS